MKGVKLIYVWINVNNVGFFSRMVYIIFIIFFVFFWFFGIFFFDDVIVLFVEIRGGLFLDYNYNDDVVDGD